MLTLVALFLRASFTLSAMKRQRDQEVTDSKGPPTLFDLLRSGMPAHQFRWSRRDGIPPSSQCPDHIEAVGAVTGSLPFGLLNSVDQIVQTAGMTCKGSQILADLDTDLTAAVISYEDEAQIYMLLQKLLRDVLVVSGMQSAVSLRQQIAPNKLSFVVRELYQDYMWQLVTPDGRPIMILVVKCPHIAGVLDDARVQGQALDFMTDAMSFSGQRHMLCMTTTFEESKFHWLPHSDDYFATTADPAHASASSSSGDCALPISLAKIAEERILYSSKTYHHTDKDLVPLLVSAVAKCAASPCDPVFPIDEQRAYMRVTASGWQWGRFPAHLIPKLSFEMTEMSERSKSFLVTRHFFRSWERRVCLVLAENSGELLVAKIFPTTEEAEDERHLWEIINGVREAFNTTLHGSAALVIPVTIPALEDASTGTLSFDFDIARITWPHSITEHLPQYLRAFAARLKELGGDLDVREVARRAIERTANAGAVLKDLAWRHVALMPVFGERGGVESLESLEPVLLVEVGSVEWVDNNAAAQQEMKVSLGL